MNQWYFAKEGQQQGPVTSQQIAGLVTAGALDPATAYVWREGLAEWKTLAESGVLAEAGASAPTAPTNPYLVTERTRASLVETRSSSIVEYPGYGRLRYFLSHFVLLIVFAAIIAMIMFASVRSSGAMGLVGLVLFFAAVAVSIRISLKRLKNLGMSGWAILWSLVPFINIWLGWRMIACPAGYEHDRTLDTAGKVITGLWIGLFVLGIAANVIFAVARA